LQKTDAEILDGFNQVLIPMISKSYGFSELEALRQFIYSKTYQLLAEKETRLWHFSDLAVFDLWENEYLTGDLTNSLYVRGDEL